MNRTDVLHLPTVLARTIANVHAVEQKVPRTHSLTPPQYFINFAVLYHLTNPTIPTFFKKKGGRAVRVLVDASSMSSLHERVMCDALLERVFFSLLSNAVKFSPQNGTVVVTITFDTAGSDSSTPTPADGGVEALGSYTFHFRNSTVTPMRVAEVGCLLLKSMSRNVPFLWDVLIIQSLIYLFLNPQVRNFYKYYYHAEQRARPKYTSPTVGIPLPPASSFQYEAGVEASMMRG